MGLYAYAWAEPTSTPGYVLFRIQYALSGDRPAFFRQFVDHSREVEGGYISTEVHRFLVDEFRSGPSGDRLPIADFWFECITYGRGDDTIATAGEPLVAFVFDNWDHFAASEEEQALVFIESVRSGKVWKFRSLACPSDADAAASPANADRARHKCVDAAMAACRSWWTNPQPWETKRQIDPLAPTGISWDPGV